MIAYDKSAHGQAASPITYSVGQGDAGAGGAFIPLELNGQEAGRVTVRNPTEGGTGYTTRYVSVSLGDKHVDCRWLPWTRLMGFSDRRSFTVSEDEHGGLIYTTHDFASAASVPETEVDHEGQTQPASLQIFGGHETSGAGNSRTFTFENGGYRYEVRVDGGSAQVQVFHGDQAMQTEHMIAFVEGRAQPRPPSSN
jgi:hypothetical protein